MARHPSRARHRIRRRDVRVTSGHASAPEHTTAVSMLDRLLHHATVVVTEGESYRMKEARSRGGARRRAS